MLAGRTEQGALSGECIDETSKAHYSPLRELRRPHYRFREGMSVAWEEMRSIRGSMTRHQWPPKAVIRDACGASLATIEGRSSCAPIVAAHVKSRAY